MRSDNISGDRFYDSASKPDQQDDTNWEERYAYSLGLQAYVWGFPWVYLSYIRWLWTTKGGKAVAKASGKNLPWAPVNSFFTSPVLASPSTPTGGSPNCDTLYATAWLDLRKEPMVLSVPAVRDRFYCLEMACIDSDNFAYVGTHSTGKAAANYLIGGPGWEGEVPRDVLDVLPRSRTPDIFVLGRTQVVRNTKADIRIANEIQCKYQVTPLSSWPKVAKPTIHDKIQPHSPINPTEHTEGAWISMNRAMTENPPGVLPGIDQTELLKLFARIGVGPNQSWENQSEATKLGLVRAAKDGLAMLRNMAAGRGKQVGSWTYPPQDIGMAGQNSDFITRAALQALAGLIAHNPPEGVYMNSMVDRDGNELEGGRDNSYSITFPNAHSFPPFDSTYHGFWSITMYQSKDFNLVKNSKAYSVNSYYPEFKSRDRKGGMTIYLQREKPKNHGSHGVYWLQTPREGKFYLILRIYVPGPEISCTQTWHPPEIKKTS